MIALTYGNGLTGSISYDNQYRITGITAGTVMNLSYPTYDANGNIMAVNNILDATKNKSFGYDALDRLSTATASGIWGSLAWTYDGVGNRLTENSNSYTYMAGTNKLSSANGLSYGFDNDGNTTAEGARAYTYNQNQRLIRVVDAGITKGEYTYNGNGQRVKKTVNGQTTVFHYDMSGQLIAESTVDGAVTADYIYLIDKPLAKIDATSVKYIHTDHLGTPVSMTDSTGAKVWEIETRPFGDGATITGSAILNLRFPGQYYDEETGLNYNYFRDYNPGIGRYIESDPLNLGSITIFFPNLAQESLRNLLRHPQNFQLFAYVQSNPVNWIDPYGLQVTRGLGKGVFGGGTGATIGGIVGGVAGAAIGGSFGGPVGGVIGGLAGGAVGSKIGGLFDPPCAGQLNCGEPDTPLPPTPIKPAPCH